MLEDLARRLAAAGNVLVFTGAGVSTGSGIPDFRGPGGVWTRRQPVYLDEFLGSEAKRVEYWEYKLEGWDGFREARPNPAHLALAHLERLGRLDMLVTQNIDGLHALAGTSEDRLVELHGTNRHVACLSCGRREAPDRAFEEFARLRRAPRCGCGGFLKPATISFGQAMPEEEMRRAFEAAARAALVLSAGSTLSVEPAASVPREAARGGAFYAVVNRGPTSHDSLADLRLEGDVVDLLPALVSLVERQLS